MRRFGCLAAAQEKEEQTTSGSDYDATEPNQFRRHESSFLTTSDRLTSTQTA